MTKSNVWRATDEFEFHLSRNAVAQLMAQTGTLGEVRGLLFGRSIDTPFRGTVIENIAVSLEGADIQSILPPSGLHTVGFFRAQRDGSLQIDARDLETFGRQFCAAGNVALLIRPSTQGANEAAVFYWKNGAPQLASGPRSWSFPTETLAPVPASRTSIRWSRLMPTAVLVIIGVGAIQLASNSKSTAAAVPASTEMRRSETGFGLTVSSRPHQVEIRWNPLSPVIMNSETGVLKITEAGTTQTVPFNQAQLRDGYMAYTPLTNNVTVALEVTGRDGGATTTASVRSVAIP